MILAAGKGERMRPLTNDVPKALVYIAGKTLLEWAIERYDQSGINDIVIAVGWKGSMIEDFVSRSGIKASVVHVSDYETGPLQTFLTAIDSFDGDFLLSPVDAMIEPVSMVGLQTHHSETGNREHMTLAVGSTIDSGTPVEYNEDGLLTRIGEIESNSNNVARSAMLLIANTRIRENCRTALNEGKERVVQLLTQLVTDGSQVRCYQVPSPWFDIDSLSDIIEANQHYLQRGGFREPNSVYVPAGDSVEIGESLILKSKIILRKGASIQGPVLIARDCEIGENCRLGPNVTIDSNTTLSEGCEITDAVIFGESEIQSHNRVHRSIIYSSTRYNVEV